MNSAEAKRAAGLRWIVVVVMLLAGHVLMMSWAIVKATGDPNSVVIPDYYQKAVNWDAEQARRRASEQLGWRVVLTPATELDALNRRRVTIELSDADGAPAPVKTIDLRGYHDADAWRPFRQVADAVEPGKFAVTLPMPAGGFHQFTLEAKFGSLNYLHEWRQHIPEAPKRGRP